MVATMDGWIGGKDGGSLIERNVQQLDGGLIPPFGSFDPTSLNLLEKLPDDIRASNAILPPTSGNITSDALDHN